MAWMPEHIILSFVLAYFVRGYTQDFKHLALFTFAGTIPDFDAVISFIFTGSLAWHGKYLHCPISWIFLSIFWSFFLIKVFKLKMRFLSVYMIMYVGGLYHFIIDSCYYNHLTVMWFWPFTSKTFSWWDLLNIKIATNIGEFTPFFMTFLMVIACVMLLMKFACDIEKTTRRR